MKKIITLHKMDSISNLLKEADGLIVGSELFATRLTNSFTLEEIDAIIEICLKNKKEIFLNVNQMFTDNQINSFIENLKKISFTKLTGIVVADLGAIIALKDLGLAEKCIYNPETLLTNATDFNFLSSEKIMGAYVAKEVTLDDIKKIAENKKIKMFMVGHGHLNMFYSKRKLLNNYQELTQAINDFNNLQNIKIVEPKRTENPYPIFQDQAGTHVFRSKVMNVFDYYEELSTNVDYVIIDTLFKDDEYGIEILKHYNNKKITDEEKNVITNKYQEKWDNGFLDNKTYYKR